MNQRALDAISKANARRFRYHGEHTKAEVMNELRQEAQPQIDQATHQWKFGEYAVTCLRCGIQRTMKQAAEKCR